ncbi:MAG: hypothetical protein EA394_04570 [Bacteroidia bacterium]|nr:MAG: hypothetical protein EA394_04570 [Bacteroidia bacterium]
MIRAEYFFARVFSTLFHPLLIPTLGIFLLFKMSSHISFSISDEARRFIMIIVFINTAIAPVLSILILKRTGYINNYLLLDRAERVFPLVIASFMFFMTYYLLRQLSLPSLLYFYIMGATLLVVATLIVSFFWKISIHMVSLGGLTGFLIVLSLLLHNEISSLIALAIIFSGFTGTSRIYLKAHSPAQVYVGYLLGALVMILLFLYLRN